MYVIIAYDISDNNVRGMVASYLLSMGLERIQRSVYEGKLSKSELKEIKIEIKSLQYDVNLVIYVLCNTCKGKQFRYVQSIGETIDDKEDTQTTDVVTNIEKSITMDTLIIDISSLRSMGDDSQIITSTIHEGIKHKNSGYTFKQKKTEQVISSDEKRVIIFE